MTYNLSNFTGADNVLDLSIAANSLVDGWLFIFSLVLVFVIVFVSTKSYEMKYSLLTSSFITFVLSGVLFGTGLVGERVVIVTLIVLLFSIVVNMITD